MYTSESGAKYRKPRESRSRSYPDMDKVYNDAKKSAAKKKALEKVKGKKVRVIKDIGYGGQKYHSSDDKFHYTSTTPISQREARKIYKKS